MYSNVFIRLIVLVLGGLTFSAVAQTNCIPERFARLFRFAEPHLRGEITAAASSSERANLNPPGAKATNAYALTNDGIGGGFWSDKSFGIIGPAQEPTDRLSRCLDSVFRPEVFRVGKTTIECSLLTAIKRKDPLCLLNINPFFLRVTW